ncbi:hypothetical protein P154DRAFT_529621 [Amniculicola lignicola CBS 123094]|uniref:RING-type domain-containing protein n=1 Tax=Amniculicola lignicola CBS 123094 TaxID=1392246 RepID=A0A6A5WY08_9PLEO|nr:hypothetical protein P154DRAFT_529621 [Amniculicola lignicola CBS 123094]
MANDTESDGISLGKDNSIAIAIILPSLFAIVLVILVAMIAGEESAASKEERRKKRMAKLNSSAKPQHFVDWAAKLRDEHPDASFAMNPICVICLDQIEDAAQIRGLGCLHVFHQECLDDWFNRFNEFCPLCHRPIIEGVKLVEKRPRETSPTPLAFMV